MCKWNLMRLILIFSILFSTKSLAVYSDNACRLGGSAFEDIKNAVKATETVDKYNYIEINISFPKLIKEFEFEKIYFTIYKKESVHIRDTGHQYIKINKDQTVNLEPTITGQIVKSSFTIEKEQLDLIDLTVYFLNRRNSYISDVPYCRYDIKKVNK